MPPPNWISDFFSPPPRSSCLRELFTGGNHSGRVYLLQFSAARAWVSGLSRPEPHKNWLPCCAFLHYLAAPSYTTFVRYLAALACSVFLRYLAALSYTVPCCSVAPCYTVQCAEANSALCTPLTILLRIILHYTTWRFTL